MKWLVFCLLLLCGCGPEYFGQYAVKLDDQFTASEQVEFFEAIEDWHEQTGVEFSLDLVSSVPNALPPNGIFVFRSSTRQCPDREGLRRHNGLIEVGRTYETRGGHFICIDPATDHLNRVFRHELGHAFGLEHILAGEAVMRTYVFEQSDFVMPLDVQQYQELRR